MRNHPRSHPSSRRPTRLAALALACATVVLVAGCGNAVEDSPIPNGTLESIVAVGGFPVYWLGNTFHGLPLTAATKDPGGAYNFQYGDCIVGGARTCVAPLELTSSPDNDFLPGSHSTAVSPVHIRRAKGLLSAGGRVIEVPSGAAVVDVRADSRALAFSAARAMAPINLPGAPGAPLPPLRRTGFASTAAEGQEPSQIRLLPALPTEAAAAHSPTAQR